MLVALPTGLGKTFIARLTISLRFNASSNAYLFQFAVYKIYFGVEIRNAFLRLYHYSCKPAFAELSTTKITLVYESAEVK